MTACYGEWSVWATGHARPPARLHACASSAAAADAQAPACLHARACVRAVQIPAGLKPLQKKDDIMDGIFAGLGKKAKMQGKGKVRRLATTVAAAPLPEGRVLMCGRKGGWYGKGRGRTGRATDGGRCGAPKHAMPGTSTYAPGSVPIHACPFNCHVSATTSQSARAYMHQIPQRVRASDADSARACMHACMVRVHAGRRPGARQVL